MYKHLSNIFTEMDKILHEVKCICLQDKKKGPKLLLFQTSLKEEMIIVT